MKSWRYEFENLSPEERDVYVDEYAPPRPWYDCLPPQPIPEARTAFLPYREQAVQVDELVRAARRHKGYLVYVHHSARPLREVFERLENLEEYEQSRFWIGECTGFCGL